MKSRLSVSSSVGTRFFRRTHGGSQRTARSLERGGAGASTASSDGTPARERVRPLRLPAVLLLSGCQGISTVPAVMARTPMRAST